jgi:hypothetical protein
MVIHINRAATVSHGLWKEKRWGGVPSFIKEHKIASHWQKQPCNTPTFLTMFE